jgi:uncharacterized protein (DUF983 family)
MKRNLLQSIFKSKCPVCREGDAFKSKSAYDLRNFDKMPEHCSHCGHKFEKEQGFWYGAMYVSYAVTVAMSVATFILTYLIYPSATVWIYISMIIGVIFFLAPITFRLSRMIWMNFFAKYDPEKAASKTKFVQS